jgi:uroporphyrinogen decarboxylase
MEDIMKRNGLDLIGRVMCHQRVAELPWIDLVGVQAASVNRYGMRRILQDEELLFSSLLETNLKDHSDGQAACFDLSLLPEVLGCDLFWQDDGLPSVISHPLMDTEEIPQFLPDGTEGRLPIAFAAISRLKQAVGEHTALVGFFCGPISLATHLRGEKLFSDMQENSDYVRRLMSYCTLVGVRMAELLAQAGCDVIGPEDPQMDRIFNVHYMLFCQEAYAELFWEIRKSGHHSVFSVKGEILRNLEMMCTSKPDCLIVDGGLDLVRIKGICEEYDVVVAAMGCSVQILDKIDGAKNFLLSLGADTPCELKKELTTSCLKVHGVGRVSRAI